MNCGSNASHDLAAMREDQERSAMVADAQARVSRAGTDVCIDCGDPIPVDRKIAAPFARRCFECQKVHEEEKQRR